jgi:hypothetical protein
LNQFRFAGDAAAGFEACAWSIRAVAPWHSENPLNVGCRMFNGRFSSQRRRPNV